jgi:hypothetical protein
MCVRALLTRPRRLPAVLSADADGVPAICNPQPLLLSCQYLSLGYDDSQLISARARLATEKCPIFYPITSPEGPPYRSGIIFVFREVVNGSWLDGNVSRHGALLRKFIATAPRRLAVDDRSRIGQSRISAYGTFWEQRALERLSNRG